MALRTASFAKHARTLTTRRPGIQYLTPAALFRRSFTESPTHPSYFDKSQKGALRDDLVADIIKTSNDLEVHPPPKRPGRRPVEYKVNDLTSTELPPLEEWNKYFPWSTETRSRAAIMNAEAARKLAEAYVPEGSRDQIVVEAFPGPGVLTRALLDLPKDRIKKLIIMEDQQPFYQFLKPLEAIDSRLTVVPLSGYLWVTYDHISSIGLLDDVKTMDWSQEHPQLQFISHVPGTVHGEQLVSQLLRSIPDRQWLFKYGRIPLHLIMTSSLWQRVSAPPGNGIRCKLSVITEATTSFDYTIAPEELTPYAKNFFPPNMKPVQDFHSITFEPFEDQVIEKGLLDDWDYVLRRMFVQKATPVARTIPQLAPGATTLLKKVTAGSLPPGESLDTKLPARKLSVKEWKIIAQAFADWPFKPDDLSIDSFHMTNVRNEARKI